MKKELEQYFGCEVKIAEYKNKLPLPIFMTMRDIVMVEIYGVTFAIIDVMKETELSVAAMKKQKAKGVGVRFGICTPNFSKIRDFMRKYEKIHDFEKVPQSL